MLDRETWRFINTFAPWFSALGTLTAVIISLYLARRASQLKVRVFPAIVKLVAQGEKLGQSPDFFQIRIVNHGREAVINGIGWWLRGIKRQNWLVLAPNDQYSAKLPKRLDFGEEATFLFPTATYNKDAKSLLERINGSWFPALTVRFLRVGVFASTGQQFRVRLDKHIRKFLLERANQIKSASSQPA